VPSVIVNSLAMLMVLIPSFGCALMLVWSLFGVHLTAWIWRATTTVMLIAACLGMVLMWPERPSATAVLSDLKLYSELTWVNAQSVRMAGPGVMVQLMLDRQRIPMVLASSLLFFCLSWSRRFRFLDATRLRSWLSRIMMLAAMQLTMNVFLLADDIVSLFSSLMLMVLLSCGLLSSWGEAERRRDSIEVLGNWMTSAIFAGLAMLLIAGGLASISSMQGTQTGPIDFTLSDLLLRMKRAPLADPMLANAFSQTRPLAFLAMLMSLSIWSGLFPFHRWLITLYRQLPLELFGLMTLWLSAGLILLMSRIALPFVGETVVTAGAIWILLSILSIFYLSLVALAQTELRRLLAVSIVRDLLLILTGLLTLRELGMQASWLLAIQLTMWVTYLATLLVSLNQKFNELDSACYGGLSTTSPQWSKLWLAGVSLGYGIPLLGMFPSRALIFLSLSRIQVSGILWMLFLFVASELLMSWTWWRTAAGMLWGDPRLPVATGPVFDQLPGSIAKNSSTIRPTPATSSILTTSIAALVFLITATAPGLLLTYWNTASVSQETHSDQPLEPDLEEKAPPRNVNPEQRPEGRS
jgi:formate hydrogenlyase subunit 3/multisubunit Na+/H+ antiporter MnhD subunit